MTRSETSAATPNGAIQFELVVICLVYVVALLSVLAFALLYTPEPFNILVAGVAVIVADMLLLGVLRLGYWVLRAEREIQHTFVGHARVSAGLLIIAAVATLVVYVERHTAAKAPKAITVHSETLLPPEGKVAPMMAHLRKLHPVKRRRRAR